MGSEWIIIIFVAIIVLLGTHKLPEIAKTFGRAVGEYNKTKDEIQNQMKDFSSVSLNVNGPVKNERQKLEIIAKTLGIEFANKSDDELRQIIDSKIGQKNTDTSNQK
jgi:sec-independent protein translocase protein TatA